VFGGSGGSRIFPSLAQVILNLECGLNLSEAIERPRVHNQIIPDLTTIEIGPEGRKGQWGRLIKDLEKRGHKIGEFDINLGVSESEYPRFVIFVVGRGITASRSATPVETDLGTSAIIQLRTGVLTLSTRNHQTERDDMGFKR
jgi:hypothetical protein